jgi:hypothetical protein
MAAKPILWSAPKDRHVRGTTELGQVWIRLNKLGLVTGVYTMFGHIKKLVPNQTDRWDLETGRIVAELELSEELEFRSKHSL